MKSQGACRYTGGTNLEVFDLKTRGEQSKLPSKKRRTIIDLFQPVY